MPSSNSPFHRGERAAQERVGKREAMEAIGQRVIRPFMPDQHRDFFGMLPFILLGSVDAEGWPWASIVCGSDGFITSPDDRSLKIAAKPAPGDPLHDALAAGAPVGVLGIELETRRRNRLNTAVGAVTENGFTLDVRQSMGNCPQYIQTRSLHYVRPAGTPSAVGSRRVFATLDDSARALIEQADTFFVASYAADPGNDFASGADVSHRGGRQGFVKVDGDTITVPDFAGNNAFNTIGNFLETPRAGLLFPDFETGNLLMLTGTVEVIWDGDPGIAHFEGAERAWRFTLDHGLWLTDALPFRARLEEWSPNNLLTDTWDTAAARKAAEAGRAEWRPLRVTGIRDESETIRSFTLEPTDGLPLLSFEAGQFLTLRVPADDGLLTRTYTVSSAPGDTAYRISVKREPGGRASVCLHDQVRVGEILEVKAPKGGFALDPLEKRPAVLIVAGVGITPAVSMVGHVLKETLRMRHTRPLTVIHAAKTPAERAFANELRDAVHVTGGKIRYFSLISQPGPDAAAAADFDASGRVTPDLLRKTLPLDDYDYYICGPAGFMQTSYDALLELGARDERIFAESFGPSALTRRGTQTAASPGPEAELAMVRFQKSGSEHPWKSGGGTLLETAEAHGLSPDFSCRSGSCGSCLTKKLAGSVSYRTRPTAAHDDDAVLICCAVPAEGTEEIVLDL
ncbi:pyridoxamine 5'-phosphate oxidase family protein [uncultured Roseobacter sp.]|uniref:FAD-binding oxidoreductase n=1 Tax=uncultured Roseobacter sp. TaxID=114847 RepID=UPI0026087A5F|nr:pyridoxamine 5'-phosphate oxidase family protein [uncultured Roseobacter sp.]